MTYSALGEGMLNFSLSAHSAAIYWKTDIEFGATNYKSSLYFRLYSAPKHFNILISHSEVIDCNAEIFNIFSLTSLTR